MQPFEDNQLNYFKVASIVLDEFPEALRQTFRSMWDKKFKQFPGFQPWDDSFAVRKMFLDAEGGKTKVPTDLSYEKWDCTALFQATIYARSFAMADNAGHQKTLSDLYVRPRRLERGSFHQLSEVSPGANEDETFALAIDQLRLLRNSVFHSTSSKMDKATFDLYTRHAKDAFKVLGVKTDPIDAICALTESEFPTEEVYRLRQALKDKSSAYIKGQLEDRSPDIDEITAVIKAVNASQEDIARSKQKINDLSEALGQDKPGENSVLPLGVNWHNLSS